MVRFETRDGRTIRVNLALLEKSLVIREMCRVGQVPEDEDFVLPLHGILSNVLLKILLWAEYHEKHEEPAWVASKDPLPAAEIELQISDWDKEFLRVEIDSICEIMEGSNYLDIPWLYKLCAQKLVFLSRREPESQLSGYLEKIPPLGEFQALFNEEIQSE
ncbi:E3 ubiquitin ligase complex SCF subunit sconC [Drosophila mauritiana]|uniref:E3 ubiquitin ligase complex SCF subunit sconC n=1 Tax=Drosophila mauritiana TaxID=7226 RepID=A0A6P8JA67_DROMA|nr:E3 ubiquitin ligase complex SCF subunit sconC [Drosophila mauritiana]